MLVWHTSLAAWVAGAVNSGTWDDIIDAHIDGVLSHYPSRAWDVEVANEVFDTGEPDGYRDTLWYQAASGPDYIPYAFERARVHGGAPPSCSSPSSASSRPTARPSATYC